MCIDISGQLTVYFDCPFWVGVFEVYSNNTIRTCRVVFGSEPKDVEVYNLIINDYYKLKFSNPIPINENYIKPKAINPKRLQRQVKRLTNQKGISTKSQQAISKQREENKEQHKKISKYQKDDEKRMKFEMRQQKKKEKHKGH